MTRRIFLGAMVALIAAPAAAQEFPKTAVRSRLRKALSGYEVDENALDAFVDVAASTYTKTRGIDPKTRTRVSDEELDSRADTIAMGLRLEADASGPSKAITGETYKNAQKRWGCPLYPFC
jgi:hypothetical protein